MRLDTRVWLAFGILLGALLSLAVAEVPRRPRFEITENIVRQEIGKQHGPSVARSADIESVRDSAQTSPTYFVTGWYRIVRPAKQGEQGPEAQITETLNWKVVWEIKEGVWRVSKVEMTPANY